MFQFFKFVISFISNNYFKFFYSFYIFLFIFLYGTYAFSAQITLAWDKNNESDLSYYKLYYKTDSSDVPYNGVGADQGDSGILISINDFNDPNKPEYTLTGLLDNKTYFFAVTACDKENNESDYSNEVHWPDVDINNYPIAIFIMDPASGITPLTVSFDASDSYDPDGSIVYFNWDFGDEALALGSDYSTIFHEYLIPGIFDVTLTVTDNSGATASATSTITVTENQLPIADFSAFPSSGMAPLTVIFNASNSYDPDGSIIYFNWDFGDGASALGSDYNAISHAYSASGIFIATLVVTDNSGGTALETSTITVAENQLPVADFSGSPNSGSVPLRVDFTDLSTNATSWSWDFGDGGTSIQQNPSYTYESAGTYTLILSVTNAHGSNITTKTDYIAVSEKVFSETYAQSDIAVLGNVFGDYTYSHASDNVYEIITEVEYIGHPNKRYSYLEHKWDFNIINGRNISFYLEASRPNNTDEDDFIFAYSTDDVNYIDLLTIASTTDQFYSALIPDVNGKVYIRASDTDHSWGNTSLDEIQIDEMYFKYSSTPAAPVAEFSGTPRASDSSLMVDFTDLSTGDPDTWEWNFGDGGISSEPNPSYFYNMTGSYTVSLTITNAQGTNTETKENYITITEPGHDFSHVYNMVVGSKRVGVNYKGTCTVTIYDQDKVLLSNATVSVSYDGPNSGSLNGTTDSNGSVYLESAPYKKPIVEWCFEVTNVTHATHSYNDSANIVTRVCESDSL